MSRVTTTRVLDGPRTVLLGSLGSLQAMDKQTAEMKFFDPALLAPFEIVGDLAVAERVYGNDDVLRIIEWAHRVG